MRVTHVGRNIPCASQDFSHGFQFPLNTSKITYHGWNDWWYGKRYHKKAKLKFKKLYNWGSGEYWPHKTPDADAIEIEVYFQQFGMWGEQAISFNLDLHLNSTTVQSITGETPLNVNHRGFTTPEVAPEITAYSVDGNWNIAKGRCKRIRFKFSPEDTFIMGENFVVFQNLNFDNGNYVTWCGTHFTKIGDNFPCLKPEDLGWHHCRDKNGWNVLCVKRDTQGTKEFWRTIWTDVVLINHIKTSTDTAENLIEIEVAVRADDFASVKDKIKVQFQLCHKRGNHRYPKCEHIFMKHTVTLTVVDTEENPTTVITPRLAELHGLLKQPQMQVFGLRPDEVMVRQTTRVPVRFNIPYNTTLPMNLTITAPVKDSRPIVHITDIKFAGNQVRGYDKRSTMYGVNEDLDVRRIYGAEFTNTGRIKTFMQQDQIFIDFGYVTSHGLHSEWGKLTPYSWYPCVGCGYEADFHMNLYVELSDHPDTLDGTKHKISFSAYIGDILKTDSAWLEVKRPTDEVGRRTIVRPFLQFELSLLNPPSTNEYLQFGTVSINSIIRHTSLSRGEGLPAFARVILDDYTGFQVDQDSVETNYTAANITITTTDHQNENGSIVDIEFPHGIMFPDTIELNFTLSLDPYARHKKGKVDFNSTIIVTSYCHAATFSNYPVKNPIQCGAFYHLEIFTKNQECNEKIVVKDPECQIQALYRYDETNETQPANVLRNDTAAWVAPLRTGARWEEWVVVDFNTRTKVTKIKAGFPDGARGAIRIRVDYSMGGIEFVEGEEVDIKFNDELAITAPITARFIKLTVTGKNDVTATINPFKMNKLEFFGCAEATDRHSVDQSKPPRSREGVFCRRDNTIVANDTRRYRHFAFDPLHSIIYFCDVGSYKKGMFCFTSLDLGITWIVLPRYIHNILGFSHQHGRMYLQDITGKALFSSEDGRRLDVLKFSEIPDNSTGSWLPAKAIPGLPIQADVTVWDDTTIYADFRGIHYGARQMVNWASCCFLEDE